jgi:hypothetical protein
MVLLIFKPSQGDGQEESAAMDVCNADRCADGSARTTDACSVSQESSRTRNPMHANSHQ